MSGDGGACACVVCVWCVRRLHGCREECGGSRVLAINVLYPVYEVMGIAHSIHSYHLHVRVLC